MLAWYVARMERWLPRWLGGYEVKDETVRWDPALTRLVRSEDPKMSSPRRRGPS
jgi:hypothetical protein